MAHADVDLVTKSYTLLCNMIFSYELPPGAMVSDFSLSKKIGISRTPIRQAILMLVADGLVVQKGNGFHVVEITEAFIDELYEAKMCLEVAIVPMLIDRKIDVSKMRERCATEEEYLNEGRYIEALDLDLAFHVDLIESTGNAILSRAYKAIYMRMKLINLLSLCSLNFRSPHDYLEIIDNIEKGDVEETRRLLIQQHESGKQQKIVALRKFGDKSINNLFNFISGCFLAFGNNAPIIE